MAPLACDRCRTAEASVTATDLLARPPRVEALCEACARALKAELESLDSATPAHWRIEGMRPRWDDFREQVVSDAETTPVERWHFATFLANMQARIAEPMPLDIAEFLRRHRDPPT